MEELTGENSRLQELIEKLKAQLAALKDKMGAIGAPSKEDATKSLTTDILKKE
ncbi:hypothetical protein ACFL0Q_06530 [Thermodesulfobacteriota bacterium]